MPSSPAGSRGNIYIMKKNYRWFSIHWVLLTLTALLPCAEVISNAATSQPSLTISNLKNGQKLNNQGFTVQGKATSSTGISNVVYSLNNTAWTNATTGNNWANWSAELTLVPGANTLSACAVDSNGNHSKTNTVKFTYVVTDVLTVVINGQGSIKPNYNGAQLQIGTSYKMTAKTKVKGFGLVSWTDGDGHVLTNSATLNFVMASNLTLIANFGDTIKPVIDITSANTNANGIPSNFIVHGTASDNIGVTNVFYQLNKGTWRNAITTNNWKTWSADVELMPGGNVFNAYAVDSNGISSLPLTAQISYNAAPLSLSGLSAVVADTNNRALFTVAFGKSTFSQFALDTNSINAVGNYTYSGGGGGGTLKIKYTAPPSAVNKSQTFGLAFLTATAAYASITNNTVTNSGYLQFSPAANLALANVSGQLIWSISSQGDGNGLLFQNGKYTSQALLSGNTNGGSYTYTQYSPVGSLFKLTSTSGTAYVLANFAGTNFGAYAEEDYDNANNASGTDNGQFLVATQNPGGNAPATITNKNFEIFAGDGSFNEQFGADTFSQDTLSTNYDNAVGNYTYSLATTNIGQLNLAITEPPTLAGTNSAARLIFVGSNIGLFTNADGTISTFVMTTATNLAPATITNTTLSLGFFSNIHFAGDGSFVYYNFPFSYPGTYTYAPYSPGSGMIQLAYGTTNITGLDWLQLNFKATNSGNIFWNQFNSETNFLDHYSGTFSLH